MKFLTRGEAETKRRKAVDFLRRIGNEEDADRFEAMDAAEYAEHKGVELLENPSGTNRRKTMPRGKSKTELEAELDEAQDYIEQLEGKLDDIAGIAADEDEEDDDTEDDQENGDDEPD